MKGIRIVRIAVNSQAQRMGYGSRAIQLLINYYEKGDKTNNKNMEVDDSIGLNIKNKLKNENEVTTITDEIIKPKKKLKPLLETLSDSEPPFFCQKLYKSLFNP